MPPPLKLMPLHEAAAAHTQVKAAAAAAQSLTVAEAADCLADAEHVSLSFKLKCKNEREKENCGEGEMSVLARVEPLELQSERASRGCRSSRVRERVADAGAQEPEKVAAAEK